MLAPYEPYETMQISQMFESKIVRRPKFLACGPNHLGDGASQEPQLHDLLG